MVNLIDSLGRHKDQSHLRSHFPSTPHHQSQEVSPPVIPTSFESSSLSKDPFARRDGLQHFSLYNVFPSPTTTTETHPQTHHHRQRSDFSLDRQVVDIVADYSRPISAQEYRPAPSHATPLVPPKNSMRPFRMPPTDVDYDSPAAIPKSIRKHRSHDVLEAMEEQDQVHGLRNERTPGALPTLDNRFNQSATSVRSRHKADKMLGLDANAKLASLYLVSGLGKNTSQWALADNDATRGIQPLEDSLGLWWRPEMLGSTFSGERPDDYNKERVRKESKSSTFTNGLSRDIRGKHVPDAGPEGPQRLVSKTIKFAHPRVVEVVNSTLSPPTTCYSFSFVIPRHDTLAAVARTRLDSAVSAGLANNRMSMLSTVEENSKLDVSNALRADGTANVRSMTSATELTFYGVTLCVWTHADRERAVQLKTIKMQAERVKLGQESLTPMAGGRARHSTAPSERKTSKRSSLSAIMGRNQSDADITASETETGMSDSDLEGPLGRRGIRRVFSSDRLSAVDSVPEDAAAAYDEGSDIFWMPYAITIVSRFPIYDILQDYLRLSWARYSKNAKIHMSQVCRSLNYDPPRPGESFKIPIGLTNEDQVVIEACMPGGLMDFDKGLVKIDFQLWPLFQALDLDHILTCAEVALSNSGRIIFCSKHPAMLGVAVNTLQYIVELRGWDGIALPIMHARDATFVIEDPGPYIIGMSTECRYLMAPPGEVVVVDIDTNSLSCKSPPIGVITPRPRREKAKQKLLSVLGHHYPMDKSIPMAFKVSFPKGAFHHFNRITYHGERPHYLGDRIKPPTWWRHEAVISVFDKILTDKHKKPSLIQRLTKSGMARAQAQLTVGEQLAKTMMRRQALHYVETRDDLESKVARINRRLLKLIQEGDHWKQQFETFEKYADKLTIEANELKTKIEKERREARRLSNIANEQSKQNIHLEEKLKNTETARAEAMRQLSDMHHSIQELEREREEIMDSIEAQINGALVGLPSTGGQSDTSSVSRAGTYTPEILGSPRSRMSILAGSQRSVVSRLTNDTRPISVLGQVSGPTHTASTYKRGSGMGVSTNTERPDSMSLRVANIQAKLEMALNVVSSQRSTSGMINSIIPDDISDREDPVSDADTDIGNGPTFLGITNTTTIASTGDQTQTQTREDMSDAIAEGESDTDNDTSALLHTPTASRRSSMRKEISSAPTSISPIPSMAFHQPIFAEAKGNEDEFVLANEGIPTSIRQSLSPIPNPFQSELLQKGNGVPVAVRPKEKQKRIDSGASSSSKSKIKYQSHQIAHARDSREIILSNGGASSDSDSDSSTTHTTTTAAGKGNSKIKFKKALEDRNKDRMSNLSTTTITFGP